VFLPSRIAKILPENPLGDDRECLGFDDRHVSLLSQDVSIVSGCSATRLATGLTLGVSEANAEISFYENPSLKLGQRDEASLVEDARTFSNHGSLEGNRRQLPWMQWRISRSVWRALALGITSPSACPPISPELRTCGTHGMVMCWDNADLKERQNVRNECRRSTEIERT
jgi:hypothetical protein